MCNLATAISRVYCTLVKTIDFARFHAIATYPELTVLLKHYVVL